MTQYFLRIDYNFEHTRALEMLSLRVKEYYPEASLARRIPPAEWAEYEEVVREWHGLGIHPSSDTENAA